MKNRILKIISVFVLTLVIIFFVRKNFNHKNMGNITMKIKDDTLSSTGVTVIITGSNTTEYSYSEEFLIEERENNEWKFVRMIEGFTGFQEPALTTKGEITIDWSNVYGELNSGKYRLQKKINNERVFVEFTIR